MKLQDQVQNLAVNFVDNSGLAKGSLYYSIYGLSGNGPGGTPEVFNGTSYVAGTTYAGKTAPMFQLLTGQIQLPDQGLNSGIIGITDGNHPFPVSSTGKVNLPDLGNPSTSNFVYDFVEFTRLDKNGRAKNHSDARNLNIDVSRVDQFGIPIQLTLGSTTVGTAATRAAVFAKALTDWTGNGGSGQPNGSAFQAGYVVSGGAARLVNPTKLTDPGSPSLFNQALSQYFDNYLAQFYAANRFTKAKGNQLKVTLPAAAGGGTYYGMSPTTDTGTNPVSRAIKFTSNQDGTGTAYYVYNPKYPPSGTQDGNKPASYQVFGCAGVFAGHSSSAAQNYLVDATVAALNRGVALTPSNWTNVSAYYQKSTYVDNSGHTQTNTTWNYYAATIHQTSKNGLAYAFGYDDNNNQSTDLSLNNATQTTITIGTFGPPPAPTPAPPVNPVVAAALKQIVAAWDNTFWVQQHNAPFKPDLRAAAATAPKGDNLWKPPNGQFKGTQFLANFDLNNNGLVHLTFNVTTGPKGKTFTFAKVTVDPNHYLIPGTSNPGEIGNIEQHMNAKQGAPSGGLGGYSFTL